MYQCPTSRFLKNLPKNDIYIHYNDIVITFNNIIKSFLSFDVIIIFVCYVEPLTYQPVHYILPRNRSLSLSFYEYNTFRLVLTFFVLPPFFFCFINEIALQQYSSSSLLRISLSLHHIYSVPADMFVRTWHGTWNTS